jgi:hypothetical protein
MESPDVIRRWWPGFGECRITVGPFEPSAPVRVSMAAKAFACVPRLFSRIGLGSLSFSVDPAWILQDGTPPASPIVLQFLRIHRQGLADEWKSRQRPPVVPQPPPNQVVSNPVVMSVRRGPPPAPLTPPAAPKHQGEKGLPSWFENYCTPSPRIEPKPASREAPVKPPEASA